MQQSTKGAQSEQKLLEILSNLTKEDITFLQEYLDTSEYLNEIDSVMKHLIESYIPELPYKVKVKKAILVVNKTDPTELVDLYVGKDEFKSLCELFGSNRVTVALRIKGVG